MNIILKRIILISVGIIFALLLSELLLALFNPQRIFKNREIPYLFNCYKPHAYHWMGLNPGSNCVFKSNSQAFPDFNVRANSFGIRGAEIEIPKPIDVTRILVVGDSFTFGLGVEEHEAYPKVVERLLQDRFPNRKFEVINAGLPGVGPGFYYTFIKNEINKINPDIVMVGFFMQNDIPDHLYSVLEQKDSDGLPQKISSKAAYIDSTGKMLSKNTPLKFRVPKLRNSHLFILLMDTLFKEVESSERLITKALTPEACLYKRFCNELDEAKEKIKQLFAGIKKVTDENNAKLLVSFLPSEFQISDEDVAWKYGILVPLLPKDKDYPFEYFSKFFDENQISYLRLKPFLKDSKKHLYYERDNHWTPEGNKLVAEIISQKLLEYIDDESSTK